MLAHIMSHSLMNHNGMVSIGVRMITHLIFSYDTELFVGSEATFYSLLYQIMNMEWYQCRKTNLTRKMYN